MVSSFGPWWQTEIASFHTYNSPCHNSILWTPWFVREENYLFMCNLFYHQDFPSFKSNVLTPQCAEENSTERSKDKKLLYTGLMEFLYQPTTVVKYFLWSLFTHFTPSLINSCNVTVQFHINFQRNNIQLIKNLKIKPLIQQFVM